MAKRRDRASSVMVSHRCHLFIRELCLPNKHDDCVAEQSPGITSQDKTYNRNPRSFHYSIRVELPPRIMNLCSSSAFLKYMLQYPPENLDLLEQLDIYILKNTDTLCETADLFFKDAPRLRRVQI